MSLRWIVPRWLAALSPIGLTPVVLTGALVIALVASGAPAALADEVSSDDSYSAEPEADEEEDTTPDIEAPDYSQSGFYVGLGGVGAIQNMGSPKAPRDVDSGGGYFLRGGYRFYKWYAVEIDHEGVFMPENNPDGTFKNFSFLLNLKGFLPIGSWIGFDRLQAYGFAGAGVMVSDGKTFSRTGSVVNGGVGLATFIREDLSVVFDASYVAGTGRSSDVNYVSLALGLEKRF